MPFELAPLAGIAVAMLALVLAIAAGWVIQRIADAIGSVSLGLITWHIGDWLSGKAQGILNSMVSAGAQYWQDASDWMYGHAWLLGSFAQSTSAAIAHLGDQVAWLATTHTTAVISQTENWALDRVDDAKSALRIETAAVATAAATALSVADRAIYKEIAATETTVENDLKAAVSHAVDKAETYADGIATELYRYIDSAVSTAVGELETDLSTAKKALGAAIAGAAATAYSNLQAAEYALTGDINAVSVNAAQSLATAESLLTGEISQAESIAASEFRTAETDAARALESTAGALAGEIISTGRTLEADIGSAAKAIEGDLTNVQTLLEAAIAASAAVLAVRIAKVEECYAGACGDPADPGTPAGRFAGQLSTLLGFASFAEAGVFIGQAIKDPVGTGHKWGNDAHHLYADAEHLLDALLSI